MAITISNYLFIGSLILLVITVIYKGAISRGVMTRGDLEADGSVTDLHINHDHKKSLRVQDLALLRIVNSYLFWISIAGILLSIVISLL